MTDSGSTRREAALHAVTAATAVLGSIAALGVLLPGPWYQLGWIGLGAAFTVLTVAGWLGGAALVAGLVAVVAGLVTSRRGVVLVAAVGVVLGAGSGAVPAYLQYRADAVPAIHDITTDPADPPAFRALREARAAAPNAVAYPGAATARLQRAAYPELDARVYRAPRTEVFAAADAAARLQGWRIAEADESAGRIEAVAATAWFGFRDDVVVRLREADGAVRVDVRSASRVGRSDLGVNAARIRDFLTALDGRMQQE